MATQTESPLLHDLLDATLAGDRKAAHEALDKVAAALASVEAGHGLREAVHEFLNEEYGERWHRDAERGEPRGPNGEPHMERLKAALSTPGLSEGDRMKRAEAEELREIRQLLHNASALNWARSVVEARNRLDDLLRRDEAAQTRAEGES